MALVRFAIPEGRRRSRPKSGIERVQTTCATCPSRRPWRNDPSGHDDAQDVQGDVEGDDEQRARTSHRPPRFHASTLPRFTLYSELWSPCPSARWLRARAPPLYVLYFFSIENEVWKRGTYSPTSRNTLRNASTLQAWKQVLPSVEAWKFRRTWPLGSARAAHLTSWRRCGGSLGSPSTSRRRPRGQATCARFGRRPSDR